MDETPDLNIKHDGDFTNYSANYGYESPKRSNETKANEYTKTINDMPNKDREHKLGHRRTHTDGGVSYKKIDTSTIMNSIQIGIKNSVGGLAAPERDLLMGDFMTVESTSYTVDDRVLQSVHSREFIFKTYAPVAFRHFRDLFGIQPDSFLSSFCDVPLVELPNPGASGSVFYLTQNDQFITKTVQHAEAEFLQKLLPGYYLNLNQNPCTLLPKFFGLYCYKCNYKNVRMIVMNNVLPSSIRIHQKYDLKGSTYKRKANVTERQKLDPTFKDLDFISHHPEGIFLDSNVYTSLVKTIQRDCRVLESFQIIDYSLLLGVHNLDQAKRENAQTGKEKETVTEEKTNNPLGDGQMSSFAKDKDLTESKTISKLKNEILIFSEDCTNCKSYNRTIPIGVPAKLANGENLLLFIGIIDILQSYRFKKRLEHFWKSIFQDGNSVSVHCPGFYAKRFQDFVTKTVFKTVPLSPKSKKTEKCVKS